MSDSSPKDFSRRQVLTTAGLGLISTTAIGITQNMGSADPAIAAQPPQPQSKGGELPPQLQLPEVQASTERDSGGPPTALPPERRLGFAVVGLGLLALEEILPAFSECKLAKPTALVSGDAAKAKQVAAQYGIKPQNIYSYQTYDNLRNNPDVDVIIVLPNRMHLE